MKNFQNDVETTVARISTIQKELLKNGDAFNVFDILGLPSKDKHTHSAFIAELLDPQGRHSQKDKFLKLFLSELNITETLDTENAKVTKDKSIGEVDWNEMTGGKIDIVIEFQNPKFAVIVENKIAEADDKQAHLMRCKKFAERNYSDAYKIFYLTVDGHEPREYSTYCKEMSLGKYWHCISYNNEIKNWLCKREDASYDTANIGETINQYKCLVDDIIEKCEIENELRKLVEENLEECLVLNENKEIIDEVIRGKFVSQMQDVAKELDCSLTDDTSFDLWCDNKIMTFIPNKKQNYEICFAICRMSTSFWFEEKIEQADKIWQFNAYESGTLILRGGSAIFEEKWVEFGVETKRAICNGKIKDIVVECIKEVLEEIEEENLISNSAEEG